MNKYEILEIIGEGTYGVVVKAMNKETNQLVAIKKFKDIAKNFIKRELKMLNSLRSCEFIVNLKEAYRRKEKVYFIFEYVDKTLLQLLQENRNGLDPSLSKNIVFQLCKAIEKCHSIGIIHRDIKPENLLIDKENNLKLCDFGFARETAINPYDEPFTEYVATRWYRSPELILFCPYGKPVDVWAIGCIACECSNSRALFPGKSDIDQIYLIMQLIGNLSDYQNEKIQKNSKFISLKFSLLGLMALFDGIKRLYFFLNLIKILFHFYKFKSLKIERKSSLDAKFGTIMDDNMLDFVKKCLTIDPNLRINIEECLKHPVFESFTNDYVNKYEIKKSFSSNFSTREIKPDDKEAKSLFYKTLNKFNDTNDNDLLIYNLLNNNFDIQKTIVNKVQIPENTFKKQIALPNLTNENKEPTNGTKNNETNSNTQKMNKSQYLNLYIRNQLKQQQKDADKLFFKSSVKFNDNVTEISKKTKNPSDHSNIGLNNENDNRATMVTSNLSNYSNKQTKIFRSESKQESNRTYLSKFENKKTANSKRSLSTLETYKNELGVKIVRNTNLTPTKNFETFSTNPNILRNNLKDEPNDKKKIDLKFRHTPDLEPKQPLKKNNTSFQYQRKFPILNFRPQRLQQLENTNSLAEKIQGVQAGGNIFESFKISGFRRN